MGSFCSDFFKGVAMPEKNYQSLFVLHVYFYCFWDPNPDYNIDKDDFNYSLSVRPGFRIEEMEMGFYQSLAGAEKRIHQLAKNRRGKIYCFLVDEKPMDFPLKFNAKLSQRRYWGNGKLWQTCNISSVCHKGPKRSVLGEVVFRGLESKAILFEEGDIVEHVREDFVELAIVRKLPATVEQVEAWREKQRQRQRYDVPVQCLGNLSESYSLVTYSESKNGEVYNNAFDTSVVNVFPTSLPVPRKIAAELRKQLNAVQESDEDDLPF